MRIIGANERFRRWLNSPAVDKETRAELSALTDQQEISDRFYRDLSFGTGGIRGIMGAGTNRMNRYTVKKAAYGLGKLLCLHPAEAKKGVVIAFDTRHHSEEFARICAETLRGLDIPVKRFSFPVPTPVLSFSVVNEGAAAGIMITASHNPKEYNGLKVYDENGVQLTPGKAARLTASIEEISDPLLVPQTDAADAGEPIGRETVDAFVTAVCEQSRCNAGKRELSIVYTPIHGAALLPVTETLRRDGFERVALVAAQCTPDGSFPTVQSPNPEERGALQMGLDLAASIQADLVLGTDPDGDRLGVGVRQGEEYRLLTGNQIGALLVDFVLGESGKLSENDVLIKTIVTGELGAKIARGCGAAVKDTLTGFKYIGERAVNMQKTGGRRFLMGYEESYGYLVGLHARDKDASVAAMLISELAAREKARGRTLLDRLNELYQTYGYYLDALKTVTRPGEQGAYEIQNAMTALRLDGGASLCEPARMLDYQQGLSGLPKENVLKFVFGDGSWAAARPSGTEPKIKFYYSLRGEDAHSAAKRLDAIERSILNIVGF